MTLNFESEKDRQTALMVIEDLIQRTESPESRALYEKQREKIVQAKVGDHDRSAFTPLQPGPYPAQ